MHGISRGMRRKMVGTFDFEEFSVSSIYPRNAFLNDVKNRSIFLNAFFFFFKKLKVFFGNAKLL